MANIGNTLSDLDEQSKTTGLVPDDSFIRNSDHQLELGKVSQGTFDGADPYDYYEFQIVAGHGYQIIVTSDPNYYWFNSAQSADFDFHVVDGSPIPTQLLSSSVGSDAFTQEITFTAHTTGTFYVGIDGPDTPIDYAATITDLGVSTQPTALDDTYFIPVGQTLHVDALSGLLRNDSDPDLDPVSLTSSTYGGVGTFQDNPDGSFTYEPAPGFSGPDTFTYTISDNNGGSDAATVTITVEPDPSFELQIFTNGGLPVSGGTALPGDVLTIRPVGLPPGEALNHLSQLGPIDLLGRPSGTNDPFQIITSLPGDRNAIAVGSDLIDMDVLARTQNGAVFQTNPVMVLPGGSPPPALPGQTFGNLLIVADENAPGMLNVNTNMVDDINGFGSAPSFCLEVRYWDMELGETTTFLLDVNSLVTPGAFGGFNFSLQGLNTAIRQGFDNIKTVGDKLVLEAPVPGDQTFYKFIEYRFQKKYTDGNGDAKIADGSQFQELVVEDDGSVSLANNVVTVDFSDPVAPLTGPENIIGHGGPQGDTLRGSTNTNILIGAGGNDTLIGTGISDSLIGAAGNDDGIAGPGFTFFNGGSDSDTFHLNGNFFEFAIVDRSTSGVFLNTHIIDIRPGSPLAGNVVLETEMLGFRDGTLDTGTGVFTPFGGFAPDGTPVTGSTSFNGIVMPAQVLIDFEALQTVAPIQAAQGLFFGQETLTESTNGVLVHNGNTYTIDPPFDAYLDLREDEGRIEVFVTDADYYNFAPPGTVDQSFSITVTNALGSNTFDFPFFIGRPDVAPVTDLGLSAVTVTENADAGTVIGAAQLTFVDDPDVEEDFLLQISGADAALFDFDDAGNLVVADSGNIDFETQQAANIVISATNLNGEMFEKAFEITIDNMPISDIAMTSGGTVREGAAADTVVATFESSENPVEPTAVLSILAGGDGQFYLDGNELKVSPGATFDFDDQSNYFITFSATDGTGPAYEESFDIFVENVGPILGTPDEDVLDGTEFSDEIQALESDDIINASNGDDDIDGGPGTDTVVYARGRNQITHDWQNDGTIVVTRTALGEGTDTLTNVERIDLDDGSLLYDVGTPNLGFGYRIYQASFDRTPDEGGVLFWIGVLDDLDNQGWSQYDKEQFLASQFIQSDEFKALFGANPTNEQYIDAMYQNVLDRLPDQGGYDFWVGGMVNDGLTREDILIAFTKSDENVDRTAPDLDDGVWVV